MARILVVDDDLGMRDLLEIMLTQEGHEVACSGAPEKALQRFRKDRFDLVITDLKMPKMDGIEFLRQVKELSPETQVILITAFASGDTALSAMKEGAYDYIEKDFDIDDLKRIVQEALGKRGVQKEEVQFIKDPAGYISFEGMIGKSREMLKIYATIKKVAETSANVLILGESGTGKELVAKAIHQHSPRKEMPFVVINCGGIPENLLESELFGYMKGSFTGAFTDKAGLFETANEGTIFLDEIGELPPLLQVKLLRVVQEKTFRRIGGKMDIRVNTRIISATNQNLEEKVKQGSFREDLYYRLNVIPITLPPLRARKEDIPLLTRYFIEKYSREFAKEIKTISSYALELLMNYPFPGNIRELENIIERSVALENTNIILPDNLFLEKNQSRPGHAYPVEIPDTGIHLNEELAGIERLLIEKALLKAGGSKTKAAELLHVSFDSLRYRIDKLGIENQGAD
ncbi:MAG TPA: sigma-54 dependent transcriptional regulator [Syntrophales bacterium]|nr:sigma-54 dependent transcriptional regulator [Syntrophales bacterium]HON22293.1 sigma-54 dependent transcriptional regulator [Syntrophales bacterium]HOU76669.1 sigma-54 dependent transcriptional regulator [Syntrophales bacterium]HPC31426.1 sigma-54 dependent transcriptional regulator [Syntrophales bacterium]HQG33332.1 sigma-54 dependent transcriptional regulator [Syntrophales bacterium]